MKIQDWKNKELGRLLREKWGLDEKKGAGKKEAMDEEIFSGAVTSEPAARRKDNDPEEETVDEGAVGGTTYGAEHGSPGMEIISSEELNTLQMLLSKVASMLENPLPDEPTAHSRPPQQDEPMTVMKQEEDLRESIRTALLRLREQNKI